MKNIDEQIGQNIEKEILSHEDDISKHGGILNFDDIVKSINLDNIPKKSDTQLQEESIENEKGTLNQSSLINTQESYVLDFDSIESEGVNLNSNVTENIEIEDLLDLSEKDVLKTLKENDNIDQSILNDLNYKELALREDLNNDNFLVDLITMIQKNVNSD